MKAYAIFLAPLLCTIPAWADDIPCHLNSYEVISPTKIAIDCGQKTSNFVGTATLFRTSNSHPAGSQVSRGSLQAAEFKYLVITLDTPLQGSTDYQMQITGTAGTASTPFDPTSFQFSTKATATLAPPITHTPVSYRYGEELWINSPVEIDPSSVSQLKFFSEDIPGNFVPHKATVFMESRTADTSFGSYGQIRLTFDANDTAKNLNARLKVTGLRTIFGDEVSIRLKKRLAPASSPKGKDDAGYYVKLLQQAGINSKPVFILDGKVAPVISFASWNSIRLLPSITADVGQGGSIGATKSTDSVQASLGIGRFIRTPSLGFIQGLEIAPAVTYETDYELVHRNTLFTDETQWFLAGTDGTLKQKNFLKYLEAKKKDSALEPQDAPKANFGYRWRFYTGIEAGSQISTDTAKASSGTSSVQVPGYGILRLYPKASLSLEVTRFVTLNLSGTGRYLLRTENVYRQRNVTDPTTGAVTPQVYLSTVSGFRPAGQAEVIIALDDAGHYALDSTLKLGSTPPNFVHVLSVQTGITIKF